MDTVKHNVGLAYLSGTSGTLENRKRIMAEVVEAYPPPQYSAAYEGFFGRLMVYSTILPPEAEVVAIHKRINEIIARV